MGEKRASPSASGRTRCSPRRKTVIRVMRPCDDVLTIHSAGMRRIYSSSLHTFAWRHLRRLTARSSASASSCAARSCAPRTFAASVHGSNTHSIGAGKTARGGGGGSASGDRMWSGCGGSGGLRCFVGTVGIDGLFYSTSTATGEEKEKTPASSTYQAFEAELVRTGWNDGAVDDVLQAYDTDRRRLICGSFLFCIWRGSSLMIDGSCVLFARISRSGPRWTGHKFSLRPNIFTAYSSKVFPDY